MINPVEIKALAGIRNDLSPERFKQGDLLVGSNIELDETGKVYRRLGTSVAAVGNMHSLWSEGADAFVVNNNVLQRINADLTMTPLLAIAGDRVDYVRIGSDVFFSDGIQSGAIRGTTVRQWGITPPPALVAQAVAGTLREGTYLYTMTYARADGKESGAPVYGHINTTGGIFFPALPVSDDPTVTEKRIYLSDWDGELPYLAMTLPNSVASVVLNSQPRKGPPLRTQLAGQAPAGRVVGYFNGRAYVADGQHLWYSRPHEYELFDLMSGYLTFPSNVQTFAAVSDGVFVGLTDETLFMDGMDPLDFVRKPICDYGTVRGTVEDVPEYYVQDGENQGPQKMWMSNDGVCLGQNNGVFKNLTGGRFIPPDGIAAGASLLKVRGGTPQFVVSLFS